MPSSHQSWTSLKTISIPCSFISVQSASEIASSDGTKHGFPLILIFDSRHQPRANEAVPGLQVPDAPLALLPAGARLMEASLPNKDASRLIDPPACAEKNTGDRHSASSERKTFSNAPTSRIGRLTVPQATRVHGLAIATGRQPNRNQYYPRMWVKPC